MPSLDEIRHTITNSTSEGWNAIAYGPTYMQLFGMVTGGDKSPYLEHNEHRLRAAYLGDVSLGLAWGLDKGERTTWEASPFPDKRVQDMYVDVLWCGMVADRIIVSVVDSNVYLPNGAAQAIGAFDDLHSIEVFAETVSAYEAALTRLVYVLSGGPPHRFEAYMHTAGIIVVPDPD